MVEILKDNTVAINTATPNLAARAEFFFGGTSGDITVLKGDTDNVTELVLSGIFEIDHQGFFMGPEGGYSSKNTYSHGFAETKMTCNLLAMQHDVLYGSTQHDFPSIISNIRALEKLVPLKKGESLLSSVRESWGMPCICLSHALFMVRHLSISTTASTHYVCPLPAFDLKGAPIPPADYCQVLCGAIIQVHFALLHFFIKGDRKSIFTMSLREMHVLCAPQHGPINPFKHICQGSQVSIDGNKKSRLVSDSHLYKFSF
ncbi:hypothetical protein M404DRAFT_166465 [Pisolithus tinctorius Marx 270]|uniref:Uncharacterized protein n=1 Tax=Pisolithus tinctorius Marx 270 TaxID=870435 RepID=A0A0C3JBX3_PISTI|nr:hypothetical protein M404DRAFT_166465 [Pisolithus tinctorius Marx 270]